MFRYNRIIRVKGDRALAGKCILHLRINIRELQLDDMFLAVFSKLMQDLFLCAGQCSDSLAIPILCPGE